MDPTELPKPLTSSNLMCLGRGSSLTPTWAPTNASQFLSSGASSTRHPMDYRIDHTKQTVRFYMEQLLTIKPEGVQVVRDAEVQLERKDHVCLKSNAPLPWDDDFHILSFWKQQRFFFKEQLFKVTKEKFGTPPATPTLSELQADRTSVAWVERWPVLQQQVEAWLRSIPDEKVVKPRPRASKSMLAAPRRSRRLAQLPPEFRPLRERRRGGLRS